MSNPRECAHVVTDRRFSWRVCLRCGAAWICILCSGWGDECSCGRDGDEDRAGAT
jgi:hypothetical protein